MYIYCPANDQQIVEGDRQLLLWHARYSIFKGSCELGYFRCYYIDAKKRKIPYLFFFFETACVNVSLVTVRRCTNAVINPAKVCGSFNTLNRRWCSCQLVDGIANIDWQCCGSESYTWEFNAGQFLFQMLSTVAHGATDQRLPTWQPRSTLKSRLRCAIKRATLYVVV